MICNLPMNSALQSTPGISVTFLLSYIAGSRRQGGSILAQLDSIREYQDEFNAKTHQLQEVEGRLQHLQVRHRHNHSFVLLNFSLSKRVMGLDDTVLNISSLQSNWDRYNKVKQEYTRRSHELEMCRQRLQHSSHYQQQEEVNALQNTISESEWGVTVRREQTIIFKKSHWLDDGYDWED